MPARKKPIDTPHVPVTRAIAGRGAAARPAAKKSARRSAAKKIAAVPKPKVKRASTPREREPEEFVPAGTSALVIVESPAKAKTIGKYLGRGYRVKATVGHLRDLPEKKLGIDLGKNFEPEYVTIAGREKTLADLKATAKESTAVYIATDPDREGEAIGWHVAEQIRRKGGVPIQRILFHEITKEAVRAAIFRLCQDHLTAGGMATISYNVLPGWRLRQVIRDMLRKKNVARVTAVHHALGEIDARTGDVRAIVHVPDLIDRSAVNPHAHADLRMVF